MKKIRTGLIFIVAGIVMNVVGRVIISANQATPNVVGAGLMAVWMIASIVLVLFGVFQLVVGFVSKDRSPEIES